MEMDQVYIELAPKSGTISQLRAEADAHRAAQLANPRRKHPLGLVLAALKTAVGRAFTANPATVAGKPITED